MSIYKGERKQKPIRIPVDLLDALNKRFAAIQENRNEINYNSVVIKGLERFLASDDEEFMNFEFDLDKYNRDEEVRTAAAEAVIKRIDNSIINIIAKDQILIENIEKELEDLKNRFSKENIFLEFSIKPIDSRVTVKNESNKMEVKINSKFKISDDRIKKYYKVYNFSAK